MKELKTIVDIKGGRLFPWPFLLLGGIFFVAGIGVATSNVMIAAVLLFLGGLILTAHQGTEIDPSSRTFREYNSFLFLKKGQKQRYESIEKIFINSSKVTQTMYTSRTTHSSTFSNIEYNAWLKFGSGAKIFLAGARNKSKLLRKLDPIGRSLATQVVDNTVPNPVQL